jgi:hypothetical protein
VTNIRVYNLAREPQAGSELRLWIRARKTDIQDKNDSGRAALSTPAVG